MLEPQRPLQRFARPLGFALFAVVFLTIASGCQTSRFYTQAIRGQYDVLSRQIPISKITNNPSTPPELKQRLQRVQALTEFASVFLKLPAEGYYQKYADLQRPHVVWNVFAADEFSIEAKTWWYPMVGSLKYQGYFRQELAENYATQLRHEGLDVYVGPVSAYSTLGWFRDPILNTWIGYEETHLAELVFHELSHRRLFIHGDTDFNEAFATATARIGVRRWLQAHGRRPELKAYEAHLKSEAAMSQSVHATRLRLARVYAQLKGSGITNLASNTPSTANLESARQQKKQLLEQLQRAFPKHFTEMPNNAWLAEIDTYERLVPGFERLYERSGSDLEMYFSAVRNLGKMPKIKRLEEMEWLASLKSLE